MNGQHFLPTLKMAVEPQSLKPQDIPLRLQLSPVMYHLPVTNGQRFLPTLKVVEP